MKLVKISSQLLLVLGLLFTIPFQQKASAATKGEEITALAKKYINVPYAFGGTSPSGFDCSGFLYFIYNQFGINLPRTSGEQYQVGQAVSKADLMPGDIVLFENTYKQGISHSGIYIGDNHFISAENSGITISSLSSSYWGPKFVQGKRVIAQQPAGSLFTDLPDSHPAFNAIKALNEEKIISGFTDQSYRPNDQVTRGQAAAIMNRVLQLPSDGESPFKDVGGSSAFYADIIAIQKAGIINGFVDGTFRPNEPMTRAQMAVIIDRAFSLSDSVQIASDGIYQDITASHWAYPAIVSLYHIDKTSLYKIEKYRANDHATRAEFAAAIYNVK